MQTLPKLTNTRLQYYGNEEGGDAVCMGGEDDIEDDIKEDDNIYKLIIKQKEEDLMLVRDNIK